MPADHIMPLGAQCLSEAHEPQYVGTDMTTVGTFVFAKYCLVVLTLFESNDTLFSESYTHKNLNVMGQIIW